MNLRGLAAASLGVLLAVPALGQTRTPVYQSGTAITRDAPKFTTNGLITKAGGLTGDSLGYGMNPTSITDLNGLGLCSNSAVSTGAYNALCLGHDASGNALITVDSYGGLADKTIYLRKNGTLYELPGSASAVAGPASTTAGNLALWNSGTGTALLDGGSPQAVNVMDARFGAVCDGSTDDSAAFVAADAYLVTLGGGNIFVPPTGFGCKLSTGITLSSGVGLRGVGGYYWTATNDTQAALASKGSNILCADTVNVCVTIAGVGSSIKGVNFPYSQPTPAGGWAPTVYPYTIAVNGSANYTALEDITITAGYNCLLLDGPSSGVGGINTYLKNIFFNGCFNINTKITKVDNTIFAENLRYELYWNLAHASYGDLRTYYQAHAIGWDLQYVANMQANGVEFWQMYRAIQATNASVTSGFGTVTFAANELQLSNISFNQVCQALSMPAGNGTWFTATMNNVILYGDTSTSCYAGKTQLDLASDQARADIHGLSVGYVDTVAAIGYGAGGILRIDGLQVQRYAAQTAAAPAFKVAANSSFWVDWASLRNVRANVGGGPIIGLGADGTQGYEEAIQAGSCGDGTITGQGCVQLKGSQDTTHSGSVEFLLPSGARGGYVGRSSAASGDINLLSDNDAGSVNLQVGTSGAGGRLSLSAGGAIVQTPALTAYVQAGVAPSEGQARITGSGDATNAGLVEFYSPAGARRGYVGRGSASGEVNIVSDAGDVQLSAAAGKLVKLLSPLKNVGYVTASLPACDATTDGATVLVTDLNGPTYAAAPSGGGTLRGNATCTNGTGWRLQ